MSCKTIASITLFIILLFHINPELKAHSLGFSFSPEMALKKSSTATMKAQAGISLDARFNYEFSNSYFIQLNGGLRFFRPSGGGSDWILYRGFNAWGAGLGAGYRFPVFPLFGEFSGVPLVTLRGYGYFGNYRNTDIHFFYPGFEVEPAFEAFSFNEDRLHLQAGIPIGWNFQRDLELFISMGISFHILYSF